MWAEDYSKDLTTIEPTLTLSLRHPLTDDDSKGNSIILGLYMPQPQYFVQLLTACTCAIVATFSYYTIVKKRGSPVAYLSGYGIVIPTLLYIPFWYIDMMKLKNTIFIFTVLTTPILTIFRCLEAMYDSCPSYAEQSLYSYISYFALAVPLERNSSGEVVRLTWKHTQAKIIIYVRSSLMGGLLYSILYQRSFQLFKDPIILDDKNFILNQFLSIMHWKSVMNNFVLAYLLYNNLSVSSSSISLGLSCLTGCNTITLMKNPLFSSSSPSEFWGGRWNLIVHGLLKRGVYIPIRKNYSKAWFAPILGLVLTFFASGLIHEYVVYVFLSIKCHCFDSSLQWIHNVNPVILSKDDPCCFPPVLGNAIMFFLWNGIVIYIERCLKPIKLVQNIVSIMPSFLITFVVIMTALPISHWFTDPYRNAHFFHDLVYLFPVILRLQ